MKVITFENLRRFIGGRRKNKDRNESPFKRSESFKRISIRRNYLECRGGGGQKGRNPTKKSPSKDAENEPPFNIATVTILPVNSAPIANGPPTGPLPALPKDDAPPKEPSRQRAVSATPEPEPSSSLPPTTVAAPVIDYGEWIRCIRAEEDLNNLKRSCSPPTPPARYRYHLHRDLDDSSRADSAISLGRIWMDAPMLPPTAPRSLELPGRPTTTAIVDGDGQPLPQRRAHHSLESALKDKRDDRPVPSRRFHRYPVAQLLHACPDKTASRSSVASTCSGKDSGFSLSAPGLSDPPRPSKQFFRKKVPRRPVAVADSASSSTLALRDQLYQGVMSRSPLRHQLKLDTAVTFVPPEKRRIVQNHKYSQQPNHQLVKPRAVVEIRDYCVPKDARLERCVDDNRDVVDEDTDDSQDRLYESISRVRGKWQESTDDADTEDDEEHDHQYHRHQYHKQYQYYLSDMPHQPQQRIYSSAVVAARNRVKRKKSARRNIKYVVKPARRAPSAVTRKSSMSAKSKSAWITSTSSKKSNMI